MKIRNMIAAVCGVIVIACMASGLPVFAAETNNPVVYVDIDGNGEISQAEREYAHALKLMQDFQAQYEACMAEYNALLEAQSAAADAELQAIEESGNADEAATTETATAVWTGPVLSKNAGTVMGPSGKEVYYNMNMTSIIDRAHARGIEGEFWVREDGVKMLGNYIMTAVSFDVHPYGSTFETSLGTAIAVDTGGFAATNPTMIDIAVRW